MAAALALLGATLGVARVEGAFSSFRAVSFGPDARVDGGTGNAPGTAQVEPAATADPNDPMHLMAGYMGGSSNLVKSSLCRTAISNDGGATWVAAGGPPRERNTDKCYGVSLGIGRNRTVYYSYLLNAKVSSGPGNGLFDISVARSSDGGRTSSFPRSPRIRMGSSVSFGSI